MITQVCETGIPADEALVGPRTYTSHGWRTNVASITLDSIETETYNNSPSPSLVELPNGVMNTNLFLLPVKSTQRSASTNTIASSSVNSKSTSTTLALTLSTTASASVLP